MTPEQIAEEPPETWRDEGIRQNVKDGRPLSAMQRSRIIEIMDAARERPSALDVETELRKWARYARSEANRRMGNPDRRDDAANLLAGGIQLAWADRLDAILARLTEPDGGEGTDPMLGTPADGRHPDHGFCEQTPCPHIPAPTVDTYNMWTDVPTPRENR